MASSDAMPVPKKNVAFRYIFPIFDADGDLVTGAAGLDSEISKDCGTFTDCTNEATEIATSSGMYYLDLTSTEMNADSVAVIVKTSTSGAKTTPFVLYPQENGDIRVDVTSISGDSTAADNAESFFDGTGYAGTNNVVPTVTTVTNAVTAGTVSDKTGYSLSSAGVQAIWDALVSGLTTVGSIGKRIVDYLTGDSYSRLGAPAGASVSADIAAINAKTTNLPPSPAATGDEMALSSATLTDIETSVQYAVREEASICRIVLNSNPATTTTLDLDGAYQTYDDELVGCIVLHFDASNMLIDLRTITASENDGITRITVSPAWGTTPVDTDIIQIVKPSTMDTLLVRTNLDDAVSSLVVALEGALSGTVRTELAAVPAANAPLADKIGWLFLLARNLRTQDDTTETVMADDGTTPIATSSKTKVGDTFSRGEYV